MIRFAAARIALVIPILTILILIILIGSPAFAQDATPKVQVFGGYSLLRADHGRLTGGLLDVDLDQPADPFAVRTYFLDGWNAEAQYNASRWLGIAADLGGRYGTPIVAARDTTLAGLPKETAYSVLAGPVISYRTKSRITPFAHALFGWDRTSLGASTMTGSVTSPISVAATNYNDVAVALGGGVDCRVTRRFSLRVGQLDWYHTSINLNEFYAHALGGTLLEGLHTHQVDYRFSAGAVVRF
jgi:opacity protein-like surface antigen